MTYTFEETYTRVLTIIRRSPIITLIEVDDKVRLGMYYLMKIYGLGFRQFSRASWDWLELCKDNGPGLTAKDIEEMEPDMDIYYQLKNDHIAGKYPVRSRKAEPQTPKKRVPTGFGWLSPTGEFTQSGWGCHLVDAIRMIKDKYWQDEYDEWVGDRYDDMAPENDFLCHVKGYVLIHNPSMDGGYVVTKVKPLTKKQREFLYDYFMALGNIGRAEMYLNEEDNYES